MKNEINNKKVSKFEQIMIDVTWVVVKPLVVIINSEKIIFALFASSLAFILFIYMLSMVGVI